MMTTASTLNYGPMHRPQAKKQVQTNPDVQAGVLAAYQLWLSVVEGVSDVVDEVDALYGEALAALQHIAPKITAEGLDKIMAEIVPKHFAVRTNQSDAQGLFISALHNASPVTQIDVEFREFIMGYRLPYGKRIVAHNGSSISLLGSGARGDVVAFRGARIFDGMSTGAEGGLHVSYGDIQRFGTRAKDSILVNMQTCTTLGNESTGCYVLNMGTVREGIPGEIGPETLYLNLGKISGLMPIFNGTYINLGESFEYNRILGVLHGSEGKSFRFDQKIPEFRGLAVEVAAKVNSAIPKDELLAAEPMRAVDMIRQIDFPKLKGEITEIADGWGN